jgi:hypothetical protein
MLCRGEVGPGNKKIQSDVLLDAAVVSNGRKVIPAVTDRIVLYAHGAEFTKAFRTLGHALAAETVLTAATHRDAIFAKTLTALTGGDAGFA